MKIRVIFVLIAFVLSVAPGVFALKPYAAYCEGDQSLHFVYQSSLAPGDKLSDGQTVTKVWELPTGATAFSGYDGAKDATKAVIESSFSDFYPIWCFNWFNGLSKLTEIEGIENINTEDVEYMNQMFKDCSSLTSLDLSHFETQKIKSVAAMFQGCSALISVDLSSFNTTNSLDAVYMFKDCNSLRFVDLSGLTDKDNFKSVSNQITGTPLIFGSKDVYVNRANLVIGDYCERLVIDGTEEDYHQLLLSVPYAFKADEVTIKRNFVADQPYTLYLPFAIDATQYGTFFIGGELNAAGTAVSFSEVESVQTEANTPYLFVPNADFPDGIKFGSYESQVTVSRTVDKAEIDGLNGVYEKKVFTADEAAQKVYYGWAGGDFCWALEGATVDACRAYFKLPSSAAANAPARLKVNLGNGISTSVSDINRDEPKSNTPRFNLAGQQVNDTYKGVVITTGSKTLSR